MAVVRDYYEKYWDADRPGPDSDPLMEERIGRFFKIGGVGRSVLDLGCGRGRTTRLLASSGKRVIGLDVSHRALQWARKQEGDLAYVQALCDGPLPFRSGFFDAVYCSEVIEHLLDPEVMIRECHRVLRPSGVLFLSTPYHGLVKNLVIASVAFERHFNPSGPHIRFYTMRSLKDLLARNGFKAERVSCLGRFWPLWMNMIVCARKPSGPGSG